MSILRTLQYKHRQEREIGTLTASLKGKYGGAPISSLLQSDIHLVWYYDSAGAPRQVVAGDCDAGSAGRWTAEAAMLDALNSSQVSVDTRKSCGAYAHALMRQATTPEMARELTVTVADMVLKAAKYKAASEIVANAGRRQREQETGEAAKRSKDKL